MSDPILLAYVRFLATLALWFLVLTSILKYDRDLDIAGGLFLLLWSWSIAKTLIPRSTK